MLKSNMKTILAFLAAGIILFSEAYAAPLETQIPVNISSPACILIEAETGTVIFEKNAREKRQTASLVKLMSSLLFMQAWETNPDLAQSQVNVSSNAASVKGATALLDANRLYKAEDLLRASIMISANDATVALAECIDGNEDTFTVRMNACVNELGLVDTHFSNCTGLNANDQYTTAYDLAVIASKLSQYELYFKYSTLWVSDFVHPSGRVTGMTNPNRLVRFYKDCDGMKTGSSPEAGYCICATSQKQGMRLIAVVLGAKSSQARFDEAKSLLEYGHSTYKRTQIISSGELTGYSLPVQYGAKDTVSIASGKGLSMLLKNGEEKQLTVELSLPETVTAPLQKGSEVGLITVLLNGRKVAELPAVLAEDARLPGYVEGLTRILSHW